MLCAISYIPMSGRIRSGSLSEQDAADCGRILFISKLENSLTNRLYRQSRDVPTGFRISYQNLRTH
jgi:hypothetical protein